MEKYLEVIEFIKVHRDIGVNIATIKEEILKVFDLDGNVQVEFSDNIVDIIYRATGERLVSATSIFIENE